MGARPKPDPGSLWIVSPASSASLETGVFFVAAAD
jgi:hypothetical protein